MQIERELLSGYGKMTYRYKVLYCRNCEKHQITEQVKRLCCKFCKKTTKVYKKLTDKPNILVILYETNDFYVAQGIIKDRQSSIAEQSIAVFNTYRIK